MDLTALDVLVPIVDRDVAEDVLIIVRETRGKEARLDLAAASDCRLTFVSSGGRVFALSVSIPVAVTIPVAIAVAR